jgi:serine protease Do
MKRNAVAWAALVVSTGALVSSSGVIRRMPAAPNTPVESQRVARNLSDAFASVADFVKPSVVQIKAQRKAPVQRFGNRRGNPFPTPNPDSKQYKDFEELLKRFFGPDAEMEREQFGAPHGGEATGSGFVYDDQGHILTNNHVVTGSTKITVTFNDGEEASATVVGTDPDADVAVIKVDRTGYRALPRGDSRKVKVGEMVMAVGSPFGLSQTVTTGIISATERNDVQVNAYESFLQTDAAINPGNSGGPLVNMNGEVIGINSVIATRGQGNDGVGFAIPIDMASHLADQLIKHGKVSRARVGILLGPLTPALAKQFGLDPNTKGVVCGSVLPGSPAEKAGLKSGDVITAFNGSPVVNVPSFRLTVAGSEAGKSFSLTYFRGGREQTTTITPAPAEQVRTARENRTEEKAEAAPETDKRELAGFGLELQPLTKELAKQFGHSSSEGLLVSSVKEGSPAEAAGLQAGMVVAQVVHDRKPQPVKSLKDLQELASKHDELALFVIQPDGVGQWLTLAKGK